MIVDTNGVLLPFRTGIDLAAAVDRLLPGAELAVPASVLAELEALDRRGVRGAGAARSLAARWRRLPTDRRGDRAIVEVAARTSGCVLTADRELGARLVARGIAVLRPRDRASLVLAAGQRRVPDGPAPGAATVKKRPRRGRSRPADARRRPLARRSGS